jgi:CTP:molybdopterin cytidylyltransferase MocA
MAVTGVVLAAGAGSRMGTPKALLRTASGEPWVEVASRLLLDAGCSRVVVVLGAAAEEAVSVIPADARVGSVVNPDWADGMASSLRAGLEAASGDAALVAVVDMPALPVAVVARVLTRGLGTPVDDDRPRAAGNTDPTRSLARAVFGGRPGHPVLIGSAHWAPLSATLSGDRGARAYLDAHSVDEVECGDLYDGHDVDVPPVD